MKEDVVPKTILVSMVKVTVTLTRSVREVWSVETTTANSLLLTSIPRMTVVSNLIARLWTTVFMVSVLNTYNLSCLLIEFRVGSLGSMDFE